MKQKANFLSHVGRMRVPGIALLFAAFLLCLPGEVGARSKKRSRSKAKHPNQAASAKKSALTPAAQETLAKFKILATQGASSVDILVVLGGNRATFKSKDWNAMAAATIKLFKASAPGTAFSIVRYGEQGRYMFGEPVDPKTKQDRAKALARALTKAGKKLPVSACDLGSAAEEAIKNLAHKDPNAQHLVLFMSDCTHTPAKDSKYAKGKEPWGLDTLAKTSLKFFTYRVYGLGLSNKADMSFLQKVFGPDKVDIVEANKRNIVAKLAEILEKAPATFLHDKATKEWNRGTIKIRPAEEGKKAKWRIPRGKAKTLDLIMVNDLPHLSVAVKVLSVTVEPKGLEVVEAPVGKTIELPDTQTNNGKSVPFKVVLKNNIDKGKVLQGDVSEEAKLVFQVEADPIMGKGFKDLGIDIAAKKKQVNMPFTLEFVAGSIPIWLPVLIVIAAVLGVLIAGMLTRKAFPRGVAVEIYGPDGNLIVDAELHEYDLGLFKRAGFVLGDQGDLVAGKDNYLEVLADGPKNPWIARPLQENMTLNGKPFTGWERLKVGDEIVSKQDRVVIKFVPVGEQ